MWQSLQCADISMGDIENTEYKSDGLVKLFKAYNQANNNYSVSSEDSVKTKKYLFNLSLRPGITLSSFSVKNSETPAISASFGNKMGVRFGVEGEFVMPFNKNKWALLIEPTFQSYKASAKNGYGETYDANYKAIELPIGVRHSFFMSDKSKIFVNVSYLFNFELGSTFQSNNESYLELKASKNGLQYGIGYAHNRKLSVEFRVEPNRDLLYNYVYWYSNYTVYSFILGYKIF